MVIFQFLGWFVIVLVCLISVGYSLYNLFQIVWGWLFRYETRDLLNEYIHTQYGTDSFSGSASQISSISESFYQRIIQTASPFITDRTKALDVGCAVGRMVFEFENLGAKRSCGIDLSKRFINFCKEIQAHKVRVSFVKENSKAEFFNGDILEETIFQPRSFSLITCINVIDRVKSPAALIQKLLSLLQTNGVLLLATPYDWSFSPAPDELHVPNMKVLIENTKWLVEREVENIPYVILSDNRKVSYLCHLLVLRKISV